MSALFWDEVKDDADGLFQVFLGDGGPRWAERAWGYLGEAGLTTYEDAIGETLVRVRLLTLASIYWTFCHHGCDEEFGWDDLGYHGVERLQLAPVRLGQLVGPAFEANDDQGDAQELVEMALRRLIEQERKGIATALRAGSGDEQTLMLALFAATRGPRDFDDEEEPTPAFEPDFIPAARVMGWIMEGMPSL